MSLTPDEVLGWATEWIYVPEGSPTVDTAEYLLAAYPLSWSDPTSVFRIDSDRPAATVVEEVMAAAAGFGRTEVVFWTDEGMRPAGLVEDLVARGAQLHEELAVLARPIDDPGRPDQPDLFDLSDHLAVPRDIAIRVATDLDTQRDFDRVGVEVFGGSELDDVQLQADLDRRDPATGVVLVAYRDGVPVGAGGVTIAGEVARLWGGSVVEAARGAGVYRALLARRLEIGRDHGCRAALVRGRLTTSAPILRRAGFVEYGEQRGYRLST